MKSTGKLFTLWRGILFFFLISFVVTVSFLIFFHSMNADENAIRANAPLVFANIFVLSFIASAAEWILHRYTVEKPVQHIREVTHRIATGDFHARVDMDSFTVLSEDYAGIGADINFMASELADTEMLRTDFISNVSHEMKTPLAVIRNYSSLLKNQSLSEEERQEYLEGIDQSVQRMTALVTNILRLNKLEHQQLQAKPVSFDLGEQVTECVLGFDESMSAKDIELEADLAEGLRVSADPELLSLVWNNLLSNAVKFTPAAGTIYVTVKPEGEDAVVIVRDTGCGMDEKTGRHIFDKFYQGDTSHSSEGNGLGLALVRRVIDLTGGEISVSSIPGKGSTFTVRIKQD